MKSIIATVQMRPLSGATIGPSPVPSIPSSPPPGTVTPQKEPETSSSSPSINSLTNLDELDLSSGKLPPSRPIGKLTNMNVHSYTWSLILGAGEIGKHRSNANTVTHISSSDIAEAGWGDETRGRSKSCDLMLIVMKVTLKPGHNKILVEGRVRYTSCVWLALTTLNI